MIFLNKYFFSKIIKEIMSGLIEELEQTHEALKVILDDESTFRYVLNEVF
jgi:hypothetical protein